MAVEKKAAPATKKTTVLLKGLLPFIADNSTNIKLHFARGSHVPEEALRVFLEGGFKKWQEEQRHKNFERGYILSLIRLGGAEWLFAGVYESLGVEKEEHNRYFYRTKLTDVGADLIGKLIVGYKRNFRQSYCCLENYVDQLEVLEIRRDKYSLPFPGYDKVTVSWEDLFTVINTDSWKTALQNLKGVYLITDIPNGKQYVGSATGDEMIWGRWKNYIDTGHGGNKELKKFKKSYIQENFQYSILDVYKPNTPDEFILEREKWWKNALKTREFGYNRN